MSNSIQDCAQQIHCNKCCKGLQVCFSKLNHEKDINHHSFIQFFFATFFISKNVCSYSDLVGLAVTPFQPIYPPMHQIPARASL